MGQLFEMYRADPINDLILYMDMDTDMDVHIGYNADTRRHGAYIWEDRKSKEDTVGERGLLLRVSINRNRCALTKTVRKMKPSNLPHKKSHTKKELFFCTDRSVIP